MRRLIGVVVVVIAVLVGLDRVALLVAQSRVADTIRTSQGLTSKPTVTIHGFPFLTQLVSGHYDDVEASITNLRRGTLQVTRIDVHLRGAHVPLGDVIRNNVRVVPVDRLDGAVTIGYADLAERTGLTVSSDGAGGVRVDGRVQAGGTSVAASATGRVSLEGRRVVVAVEKVTVQGQPAPAAIEAVVRQAFSFSVIVPTLPFGIELRSVRASASGVVVTAVGNRIVLRSVP